MLISFQGFGHGDSTDFKDLDGFFQQDWISVFSLLRQLPELILDFKLMVFSKELVFFGFFLRIGSGSVSQGLVFLLVFLRIGFLTGYWTA